MKRINSIIIAAIAIMAMSMSSCKKDVALQRAEQEEAGTISVSVDAVMGEYAQDDASKAGLVSTTRVSWQNLDVVYVFDGAKCLGELLVTLKDGKDYYACLNSLEFAPLLKPQAVTKKLTLVYSNATVSEISDGKVSVDISAQEGNTSPKDIPFVAIATLDYTSGTPEIRGQIADFSLATSLMRLNCSGLAANAAITGATLTGMSNECLLEITKDGPEIIQGKMGDINVDFKKVSANAKGTQTLYAAVAQNGTESAQTLEIQQTQKYCYNFGSKARNYAKAYNAICPLVKAPPAGALPGVFSVSDTKKVYFSKGNLYADDKKALYFEANQYAFNSSYQSTHVSHFTWSSTVDAAVSKSNSGDNLFCDENHKVSVDGSEAIYYALSKDEWVYLFNTRTMTNSKARYSNAVSGVTIGGSTYKGVFLYPDNYNGEVVSGSMTWDAINAAGIVFLPAAGFRNGSSVDCVDVSGGYWSSAAHAHGEGYAYFVYFFGGVVSPDDGDLRSYGYSVRLITCL